MLVYNGERYLAEAIESILTQTLSDLELIVVDDCSTDGSAAIVRDYASSDERVRLIQNDRNRGLGPARNRGIAVARGEFIATRGLRRRLLAAALGKAGRLSAVSSGYWRGWLIRADSFRGSEANDKVIPTRSSMFSSSWSGFSAAHDDARQRVQARRAVLLSVGGYEDSRTLVDDKEFFASVFQDTIRQLARSALRVSASWSADIRIRQAA